GRRRILCGDFNTPRLELDDGRIVTWGQILSTSGEIRMGRKWKSPPDQPERPPDRWDRAERAILEGLAEFDLPDVYRLLNGKAAGDYSWYWRAKGKRIGRRFDHVFASRQLNPVMCQYVHEWRESGMSDHSAIEVLFNPAPVR